MKLQLWARGTGTIVSYQHGYHRGGHYYQPVVQFSVADDTEEQYTFVSKQRRGEDSTAVGTSVDVLYNAADPTQAEIVQRLQQEASGLFRLSLLILGAAAVLICFRSIALKHIEMMDIQQQEDSPTYESMDRNTNGQVV